MNDIKSKKVIEFVKKIFTLLFQSYDNPIKNILIDFGISLSIWRWIKSYVFDS